jgi:hypothetical protein
MKTIWLCIWVLFAAAEVGLTYWFRSATFLEIGAAAPVMFAYNLFRARVGPRAVVQDPVETTLLTPVNG